ncbi:MAG: SusC/RagA family TonB-linked outer membrane protein [Gemmatimonadales bacterium]
MRSPLRWWYRALVLGAGFVAWAVLATPGAAQVTGTVRGQVVDGTTKRPVDGVQVYVPGTDLGTLSNATGQFELNLKAGETEIRVRRVGYASASKNVTVTPGQTATVDFELGQAAIGLDAVVVTGAGTETEKRKLGNTVATIDSRALTNAPVVNLSEALAAREAGVVVLPSGGLTGEGARIRIRGAASLSQPNEPIVYIDGVRVDRSGGFGDYIGTGGGGTPSRLDDINPDAIERIEILKGAAAATLYGTEASSGVIQVFTKTGSRGAPRFDFTTEQGFLNYPASRYKPNAGFARFADEAACVAAGNTATLCQTTLPVATRLSAFYGQPIQAFQVFEKEFIPDLFETGSFSSYSGSVSGGTAAVNYFVNARLQRENGPFGNAELGPANDFNRKVQGSASLVMLPIENLKIRVNTQYVDAHHETPQNNNNIFGTISTMIFGKPENAKCNSLADVVGNGQCRIGGDPNAKIAPGNPYGSPAFNTVRETMQEETKQDTKHFTGSLNVGYQPTQQISVEATVGVDVVNQISTDFDPFGNNVDGVRRFDPEGFKFVDNRTRRELTAELKGTWNRRFGEHWQSTFVAGGQGFITRLEDEGLGGEIFPGPGLEVVSAGAFPSVYERILETVAAGGFVQEQMGYKDFAFVTVGARYDRNSAFGKTSEGVLYPKASVSFIPSALPSWGSSGIAGRISTLRVRAAIGQSGLQPGAFDKFTTFSPLNSSAGPGFQPNNLGNPILKPEISTEREVGMEIGLWEDRFGLEATYYRRTTSDALWLRQFAPSGGFPNLQLDNIGEIEAGGWELGIKLFALNRPSVSVNLWGNASWGWQWVTDLGTAPPLKVGGSYPRYRNFIIEGYPVNSLFGPKLLPVPAGSLPYDVTGPTVGVQDGVPDTEAQLLLYFATPRTLTGISGASQLLRVDEDGDGDFLDHYLGKSYPDWQGSFGTNATFLRNLELSLLFEYKFGDYTITNLTDAFRQANAGIGRNIRSAAEVEATIMNPASTAQQRLDAAKQWLKLKALTPHDGLNQNENGAFVRWRELGLTYNVPARWAEQKLGLRYVSIKAAVRNVALWTGYKGIDPELNVYGRGAASSDLNGIAQNFGEAIDAFGFALPRRFTFTVRFGF